MNKAAVNLVEVIGRAVELRQKGRHWWGCCPFHAENSPSFQVDPAKGLYHCFGCGKGGDALAFVMEYEHVSFPEAKARLGLQDDYQRPEYVPPARPRRGPPSFSDAAPAPSPASPLPPAAKEDGNTANAWRDHLRGLVLFGDFPGAVAYLCGRGIPPDFPTLCHLRAAASWYGKGPAVVFPIMAPAAEGFSLVAVQGRYLQPLPQQPKVRTAGPSGCGVFMTPGALEARQVVVTEAPIDALSLAVCGFPAVALIGTHCPDWLPQACAGRQVLAALDGDPAGDAGSEKLCASMTLQGVTVYRLRPDGAKDWNELLQLLGIDGARAALEGALRTARR